MVTTVGVLMAGIDARIVMIGLPVVATALKADAEQAIWFTQAYTLGSTIVLLLIGRITDLFGRIKVYNWGFVIFTVGSALSSLALNPTQLIAFRALQGIGSGVLMTNSVVIIMDATPDKELGFALSLNNLAFRFGAMAGLTISGVILSLIDWRALFYINVPIGIFGTIWAYRRLREISRPKEKARIDWIGFFLFTLSITSFLLVLTYAAYGMSKEVAVYALLVFGTVTLIAFFVHQRAHVDPLLDLGLFKIREYCGGLLAMLINAIAWGAVLLLLSLYLELVKGLDPFSAGLRLIPFDISFLIVGPLSGKLSDKFGPLPFTTSGLVVGSLSLLFFSTVDASTPYLYFVAYLVLSGAGFGLFGAPNLSAIMGCVPIKSRGVASALRVIIFNIGLTLSLSLAILVIALKIPYSLVSTVISSYSPAAVVPVSDITLFAEGLKNAYLWFAVINLMAIIPSFLRSIGTNIKGQKATLLLNDEQVASSQSRENIHEDEQILQSSN
jgi:EmrB/QacA subfamily drug resistance transporter